MRDHSHLPLRLERGEGWGEVSILGSSREAGRYEALARKLAELDRTQKIHGEDIQLILHALKQLEDTTSWAYPEGRRLIGFRADKPKGERGK